MYSEGRGTQKNVEKSLDLLMPLKSKSAWAREVLVQTAIDNDMMDCLDKNDLEQMIAYRKNDIFLLDMSINNGIVEIVSPVDSCKITLYKDSKKVEEVHTADRLLKINANTHGYGLYASVATWESDGIRHAAYSIPCLYAPGQKNSTTIQYYYHEYPYGDLAIVVGHGKKPHIPHDFQGRVQEQNFEGGINVAVVGCEHCCVDNSYFSGTGIINGRYVYGRDDIDVEISESLSDSVGHFSYISINENRVLFGTDYFGLSRLFYYKSDEFCIFSNRYHLLLLLMYENGVKIRINESHFRSVVYMTKGMLSEQTLDGEMICDKTFVLDPGVRIIVSAAGIQYKCNDVAKIDSAPADDNSYRTLLEDAAKDIISNLQILADCDRFDTLWLDLTGGIDSRMVASAFKHIKTSKSVFVNTSGNKEKENCIASNVASLLDLHYNSHFIAHRKVSGGYELPVDGSLDIDSYLNLVLSVDMGLYDSSYLETLSYGTNVLHVAGWGGEVISRPFVSKQRIKMKISESESPESVIHRYVARKSRDAVLSYDSGGVLFEKNFSSLLHRFWDCGPNTAFSKYYLNLRVRFHDDFSKNCSYGTASCAPLFSKKAYKLFMSLQKKFDSFKYAFDLLNVLSQDMYVLELMDEDLNLERAVIIRDELVNPDSHIIRFSNVTEDFKSSNEAASKENVVIKGTVVNSKPLPSYRMNESALKRCREYLEKLSAVYEIHDTIDFISKELDRIEAERDWKSLSTVYKKLGSAAMILCLNCDNVQVEYRHYHKLTVEKPAN